MADGPRILEVRTGRGDPASISLKQGTVLDPTSVGSGGMWRVDGPGIREVHGYIYFDGKALYVQSADDASPLLVNKHRVATAWTEVRAPSSISLGDVEIVYRDEAPAVYDDGDETVAAAIAPTKTKPEFVPGGGAFVNRADDESTRFAPIEGIPGAQGPSMDPVRPAAGTPAAPFPVQPMPAPMDLPPGMMMQPGMQGMQPGMPMQPGMMPGMPGMPMQPGMPGMPMQPGMPGMPGMMMPGMAGASGMQPAMPGTSTSPGGTGQTDPGQGKQGFEKFKAEWEALPSRKRVLYIMAPFTLAAAILILFDDPPPQKKPHKTVPSASVSAMVSAPHVAPSGSAPVVVGPVDAGATPTQVEPADAGSTPATPATTNTSDGSKTDKDAGSGNGAPPAAPTKRTTEREAADAWAEGNFDKAAKLYDQLATENPQNPAYREAARILREKLDGGAR